MHTIGSGKLLLGVQRVQVVLREHQGEDWIGEADAASNTITLREGMPPTQAASTLLHEIAHFWMAGVYSADDEREEELVVGLIERGLAGFMRDNPNTVRLLLDIFSDNGPVEDLERGQSDDTDG